MKNINIIIILFLNLCFCAVYGQESLLVSGEAIKVSPDSESGRFALPSQWEWQM